LSGDDITAARKAYHNLSCLISDHWSKDPAKLAVIRAVDSCQARLGSDGHTFGASIVDALAGLKIGMFPSFLFIGSGGSALLNSFQVLLHLSSILSPLSSRYPDI